MLILFNLNIAALILLPSCHRAQAFCPPRICGKSRRSSLILGGEVLTSYPDGDSLEKFSLDVKKVLKEIRGAKDDPTIPGKDPTNEKVDSHGERLYSTCFLNSPLLYVLQNFTRLENHPLQIFGTTRTGTRIQADGDIFDT
jgi:hypothetical protein